MKRGTPGRWCSTDRLFLSREACVDLGLMPHNFPAMVDFEEPQSSVMPPSPLNYSNAATAPRGQSHALSPPHYHTQQQPTQRLHCNIALIDYYASSTFNICKHSPYTTNGWTTNEADGRPTCHPHSPSLSNPGAPPLARSESWFGQRHKLEVLKPVSIGEPVTRMVSPDGHLCKEKQHTETDNRYSVPQHQRHQRNTPYTITFPPSTISLHNKKKKFFNA